MVDSLQFGSNYSVVSFWFSRLRPLIVIGYRRSDNGRSDISRYLITSVPGTPPAPPTPHPPHPGNNGSWWCPLDDRPISRNAANTHVPIHLNAIDFNFRFAFQLPTQSSRCWWLRVPFRRPSNDFVSGVRRRRPRSFSAAFSIFFARPDPRPYLPHGRGNRRFVRAPFAAQEGVGRSVKVAEAWRPGFRAGRAINWHLWHRHKRATRTSPRCAFCDVNQNCEAHKKRRLSTTPSRRFWCSRPGVGCSYDVRRLLTV